MGFLPLSTYEEYIKLKKMNSEPALHKKCIYCKRQFNKRDNFIGNSRKYQMICRKCAVKMLEVGLLDADRLKKMFEEQIKYLNDNKEDLDKDEMLNNL
jgi:superfamily II helicase